MNNKRRVMAVILTAVVLCAVISSLFAVIHEAHHDCTGENCRICAMIAVCRGTLRSIADALVASACVFACLCFALSVIYFSRAAADNKTPISLKVKLLN